MSILGAGKESTRQQGRLKETEKMLGAWQVSLMAVAVLYAAVPTARCMPGGWKDVDVQDEGLKKAMSFAMLEYNKGSNDMYRRNIMSISEARRQIVAGINYEAEVVTGLTTCLQTAPENEECPFHTSPYMLKQSTCTFRVNVIPWLHKRKLLDKRCNHEKRNGLQLRRSGSSL
ncbi:cystatin-like [Lissotriton helveticus]